VKYFTHKLQIHYNYNVVRIQTLTEWCKKNIPNEYIIDWIDNGQYGYYELGFEHEEDLLVFKLAHSI
jgi:hypothetical protein